MKCIFEKCVFNEDCVILDILNKIPKNEQSCSYFKTQETLEKEKLKLEKMPEKRKRTK
jgi:hypothetical protein